MFDKRQYSPKHFGCMHYKYTYTYFQRKHMTLTLSQCKIVVISACYLDHTTRCQSLYHFWIQLYILILT